jgi:hypothetical protein
VTVPTGTAVTVTVASPRCPSLDAVMVALPGARAVTTPVADTLATSELLEDQLTARSVSVAPLASFKVADSVAIEPAIMGVVEGKTVTDATGTAVTVTLELPDCPSHVAVIAAPPGMIAVTTPLDDTVATSVLLDDHATARSVRS